MGILNLQDRLYISTIAENECALAAHYGLGLEIAEYCTAYNMDTAFSEYDPLVRHKMESASRFVFHAPFNELCPAAIDPLVVEIAKKRYEQAVKLAGSYGINRIVVHSGYIPLIYHKSWFAEKSVDFWREFLADKPDNLKIYLENVMEDEPEFLTDIVRRVDDPRFGLCLDVGHASTIVSDVPLKDWVACTSPFLKHVHLHNNQGNMDLHASLGNGIIHMAEILSEILRLDSEITFTIESIDAETSVAWLLEHEFLQEDTRK